MERCNLGYLNCFDICLYSLYIFIMNTVSFASFNCHVLNNGKPVIADLLESVDVLCIQEHWLSNKNINLLAALHNDYIAYGVSDMLDVTEEMIVHGRPFGGVTFLWRQNIA